jgi:hypothetical protein
VRFFGWPLEENALDARPCRLLRGGNRKALHVEIILRACPSWPLVEMTMGLHLRASKNERPVCALLLAPDTSQTYL